MAGLARAFVVGGFVQRDVDVLAISPHFVIHREFEAVGLEAGARVADDFARDGDFGVLDQALAPLARAEALRLQDAIEGEFAHFGTTSGRLACWSCITMRATNQMAS